MSLHSFSFASIPFHSMYSLILQLLAHELPLGKRLNEIQ
jgi:hypothetical protein